MTADGAAKPDALQPAPIAAPHSPAATDKLVPSETGKLVLSETGKLNVFISYSRADIGFADELDAGLQVMNFATSLDRHSIVEGEDWKKRLGGLIADADTVVFVISPDSAGSPVCQWEIDEAVRLSKRILPVLWRPPGTIPVPEKLAALNYVRFDANEDGRARSFMAGLKALTRALETDLDWLREHTRLLARAMEWNGGGKLANRLLSGDDIAKAKAWIAAKPRTAPEPTALHLDFVRASENWEGERQNEARRQLADRERLVREAEAAVGEKAAAQQREAEAGKRVIRRTLIGAAASLALAVLAGGFGYYAYLQQAEAENQAHNAELALVAADRNAQRADREQRTAQEETKKAEKAAEAATAAERAALKTRDDALLSESKHLADRARQVLEVEKDAGTALLLALEALPDERSDDPITRTRAYHAPAEVSLEAARRLLREKGVLAGHTSGVTSVAVTSDGARIVTGSSDNTARVWDAKTFAEIGQLKGHTGGVSSVAVTPDGARIVTGSEDHTARVWDAKTFAEIGQLKGHTGPVTSVAVTADGARIVTGSNDNTARVWVLFPAGQALVADAQRIAPRCLTPDERQRYHLSPAPPRWCATMKKWPYDPVTIVNTAASTAQQHIQADRHREAIAGLEQFIERTPAAAARLAPALASAHNDIAWAAFLDVAMRAKPVETLKDVLADAEKAVQLAPDDTGILDTRGQIYLALGRIEEAFTDLDKAIEKSPDLMTTSRDLSSFTGIFFGRGRAQELRGNRDAAIADYRKELELIAKLDLNLNEYTKHAQSQARARLTAMGVAP